MIPHRPAPRTIPLWKLVAGAAVHCVVPGCVLALGVHGWRFAVGGGDLAGWLGQVPGVSLWFLGAYAALAAGATGVAALIAPRPAPAVDPQGAAHLRDALTQGRGAFGAQADAALDRISALRLDPQERAVAGMLRDLAGMVAAGRAAGDTEPMRAMTTTAIERIAARLEAHAHALGEEAQDRALVMATYVEQRYGQDEM